MGVLYSIKVPKEDSRTPIIFSGSYIDGYPFPRLTNIGLKIKQQNRFVQIDEEQEGQNQDLIQNDLKFFDLIKANRESFVRLTELKIYYDMETIFIEKDSYEHIFGKLNSFNDFGQKEKKCLEKYLETLKGIQFSYKRLVNKQI